MTSGPQVPQAKQERLARGTLRPDMIARPALCASSTPRGSRRSRCLDWAARWGPRRRRSIDTSPVRDEVVLGVADVLIGEALEGFEPAHAWVETLRDLGRRIWATCERHPAAMSLTYMRTTRRPNEMRAVEAIMAAVLAGGWQEREAVMTYRGYASFVLGIAGAGATFMSLPEEDRDGDQAAWPRVYGHLDARALPPPRCDGAAPGCRDLAARGLRAPVGPLPARAVGELAGGGQPPRDWGLARAARRLQGCAALVEAVPQSVSLPCVESAPVMRRSRADDVVANLFQELAPQPA